MTDKDELVERSKDIVGCLEIWAEDMAERVGSTASRASLMFANAATEIVGLRSERDKWRKVAVEQNDAAKELNRYTSHSITCAVYSSYAGGYPKCSCGLDGLRTALTAFNTAEGGSPDDR